MCFVRIWKIRCIIKSVKKSHLYITYQIFKIRIKVVFDLTPPKKNLIFCLFSYVFVSQHPKRAFVKVVKFPHFIITRTLGTSIRGSWVQPYQALQGWPGLGSQKGTIPGWTKNHIRWPHVTASLHLKIG